MKTDKKTRPFGLKFVEALSDAELAKITGDKGHVTTLALSIRVLHNGKELTDEF